MPRKVFVAGEILTAADVNTNLMDQSVMVFDDATARTTAIPTPVEGMVTYLKEDEAVTFFDGDAFRVVGGLIAVKSAIRDTPFVSAPVGDGGNATVPDLEIIHEVADPANRLIISAFFGAATTLAGGFGNVGIAVHDGTGFIAMPASPGNRSQMTAGGHPTTTTSGLIVSMPSVTFVHTPGAGSKTYTVRGININNATDNIIINRSVGDNDREDRPRTVSSLVIQEVAV